MNHCVTIVCRLHEVLPFAFPEVHHVVPASRLSSFCVGLGRKQLVSSGYNINSLDYCEEKCLADLTNSLNLAEDQVESWLCLISCIRLEVSGTESCTPALGLAFHMATY